MVKSSDVNQLILGGKRVLIQCLYYSHALWCRNYITVSFPVSSHSFPVSSHAQSFLMSISQSHSRCTTLSSSMNLLLIQTIWRICQVTSNIDIFHKYQYRPLPTNIDQYRWSVKVGLSRRPPPITQKMRFLKLITTKCKQYFFWTLMLKNIKRKSIVKKAGFHPQKLEILYFFIYHWSIFWPQILFFSPPPPWLENPESCFLSQFPTSVRFFMNLLGNPVIFVPNSNLRTCSRSCGDQIDLKIGTHDHVGITISFIAPRFSIFFCLFWGILGFLPE